MRVRVRKHFDPARKYRPLRRACLGMAMSIEDVEAEYPWATRESLEEILRLQLGHAYDTNLPRDRLALANWPHAGHVYHMHARAGGDAVEHWVNYYRYQMDDVGRLALQLLIDPEMASSANAAEAKLRRTLKRALTAAHRTLDHRTRVAEVAAFPGVMVFAHKPSSARGV